MPLEYPAVPRAERLGQDPRTSALLWTVVSLFFVGVACCIYSALRRRQPPDPTSTHALRYFQRRRQAPATGQPPSVNVVSAPAPTHLRQESGSSDTLPPYDAPPGYRANVNQSAV
jgi:hypothetical protein